jgi:hypothetical protein
VTLYRRRDGSCEAAEQGEGVEVDGDGAVAEGLLQRDADEAVGARQEPFGGNGGPQDVLEEGLAALVVLGTGAGGGVEGEAELADRERRGDGDAGAPLEGELHGTAEKLGASRSQAGDGCGGELREGRVALGEVVVDMEEVGVTVDADDAAALEVRRTRHALAWPAAFTRWSAVKRSKLAPVR